MNRLLRLLVLCGGAYASAAQSCGSSSGLDGMLAIPTCSPGKASNCVPAPKALYDYMNVVNVPDAFTLGAQTSPWRMYDGEHRILTIDEVAASVRARRKEHSRVLLIGSWTAKLPGGSGETLVRRLSAALDGFPVDGTDGFLWLSAKGEMRTTQQAFSGWQSGPYYVEEGEEVMAALVPGALAQFEDRFASGNRSEGVILSGVGHDVFGLCPEKALAAFERAAAMGNAIGAYNASLMYEQIGDRSRSVAALRRAADLNDDKAKARLASLRESGVAPLAD